MLFGLSLVTPELITITITDKWSFSAEMLRILCIGSAFSSISSLYFNLIISKGKSYIYMWNTIILGVIQVAVMVFSHSYGILTMITLYVSINAVWLFVWQYFVWREIRLSLASALKDILPFAVIAGISMYVANYVAHIFANIYIILFTKIAIAVAIYTVSMWLSDSVTFKESIHFLFKKKP
jgi:O-antigen/teichoic acid export membrane protein